MLLTPSILLFLFVVAASFGGVREVSGASTLKSSFLTEQDVIDFLRDGHIVLRNVLPELRDASFREEYEAAKKVSSLVHEKWFIEYMGCNKPGMVFMERVEAGEGLPVLKDCADFKYQESLQADEDDEEDGDVRDDAPFNQIINLHEHSSQIRDVVIKFGPIVADLLRVERVRLYQSRTFLKVPSEDETMRKLFNHATSMHADLTMVPLDTNAYLTFWCPARNVTGEDSLLMYATGSHRDIAKQTWHETVIKEEEGYAGGHLNAAEELLHSLYYSLPTTYYEGGTTAGTSSKKTAEAEIDTEPESESELLQLQEDDLAEDSTRYNMVLYDDMKVGDCAVHHGYTLHGATLQVLKNGPRDALTFSYIDGDARKLRSAEERDGDEFMEDYFMKDEIMVKDWYYDIAPGEVVDHPKLMLAYPPPAADSE